MHGQNHIKKSRKEIW